jgi:hypothetical protein
MGREFYQSAMKNVIFDDFYSVEVANFMLKFGIESPLPETEASLRDSDDDIFLLPDCPVANQRKRKGTIQFSFMITISNYNAKYGYLES